MWDKARLRSASATVELELGVAADAACFPLPLALPGPALAGSGVELTNEKQSLPWFGCACAELLFELPCVLAKWPGYAALSLLAVKPRLVLAEPWATRS